MTITSWGYDGTVDEVKLAKMTRQFGADHVVAGAADFKCTIGGTGPGGTDRAVTIATGVAFGPGVMDVNDAAVTLNATSVVSGSRWDTVVLERDWSGTGGESSLAIRVGTSTKALSADVEVGQGVLDDQPLALIRVQSGQTAIQELVDLRAQAGKVHTFATEAALALRPVIVGEWAFTLDSRQLWHGEVVGVTNTWVSTDNPAWTDMTFVTSGLKSKASVALGGPTPGARRVNGRVEWRGEVERNPNTNGFPVGDSFKLGSIADASLRPATTVVSAVACEQMNGYNTVRVSVNPAGEIYVWIPIGVTTFAHWVSLNGLSYPAKAV